MVRSILLLVASVVVLAGTAGLSSAQPLPVPGAIAPPRPTFSPYLNLANGNMDPAVSYYGIIRPQIAASRAIRSLQQQVTAGAQPMAGNQPGVDPNLPLTGQPAYFLNSGAYFLNSRTGAPAVITATTATWRPSPLNPPTPPRPPRVR
jgi:hypothetical protein